MQRPSTNPFISPQPPRELHAITKEQQKTFQHMTYFQSTQLLCPSGPFQTQQHHQIPPYLQQMSMVNSSANPLEMMPPKPKAQSYDSLAMRTSQTPTHTAFVVPSFPTSSEHGVFVSHIEDGPELFHVQLKERQPDLINLMEQLKTVRLEMLDRRAQPCQPVIARYSLDKQLYRAVIMSVKTHACEVLYVDYGNCEILRYENIFKIPDVFLGPPVFAISFALANHRSLGSVITEDVKRKFDQLVRTSFLRLKVAPWQGPPLIQWCELYDNDKSILEALLQFKNMKNCHFMPPICLNVGDQERAFVCYIHSPKQFYVQLKKFDSIFEKMIDEMERELSKLTNNTPSEDTLKPGLAVAAMYEDKSWYRGQIHQVLKDKVIVQFIDFGNYEKIAFANLRFMPAQKYMDVAPQAVACCLKSFENEDKDSDATRTQFELMVQNSDNQRKMMKLHVMGKIRDSILLVELFDESLSPPLNVNKRILKLSMPQNKYNSIQNTPIINSTVNSQSQSAVWETNTSLGDSNVDSGKNSVSPNSSQQISSQVQVSNKCQEEPEPVLMPFSTKLVKTVPQLHIQTQIKISCWHSPHEFYVQLENRFKDYEQMMRRLQIMYSQSLPSTCNDQAVTGNFVVAKNRKDTLWYRAKLTDHNSQLKKYKLEFVDVGNRQISCEDEVFPIYEEFTNLPIMAVKISLENIVSCGDWTELSNNLTRYITPQKSVVCEFLKEENERFFATVQIENEDLKTSLINDNFVKDFAKSYDLKFLVGQTVLLHMGSVKSLHHFFAKFDGCDIFWPCSYYDPIKAKQIESKLNLKSYEHKTCIAKIREITQSNIFCVSLADAEDFVPQIHYPIPSFSSQFQVDVVHVEKPNVVYVRPTICEDLMNQLLDDMYEFYEKGGTAVEEIQFDDVLACQSPVDDNYYRCTVGNSIDRQHVEVIYIDYGNTEVVPKTNLKALDPRFKCSALILRVFLPYTLMDGVSEREVINELTQQTANFAMTLTLIEPYRDTWWIGNISYNGVGVDQILSEGKKTRKVKVEEVKKEIDALVVGRMNNIESNETSKDIQNSSNMQSTASLDSSFDINKLQSGVLCHVDDPENFYICLKQDIEAVEELTTNLQIVAPSLPTLEKYEVGSLCIAKYSVHDKWYRAKIIGFEPDMITLYYIDHGFIDCLLDLELAKNLLKVHQEMSPRAEGFAINCALIVKPMHKEWPDNACAVLREFLHKEVFFDVISIISEAPPQKHLIKMYCNCENMANYMVTQYIAVAYRPILSFRDVFVSHINSLSDFYIQMDDDSSNLEILASYLTEVELDKVEFPELQTIQPNTSCIALFHEDNLWYRAKILAENEDGTVNVFFIDYGNTCSFLPRHKLRELKPIFDGVPPFAMKCSLKIPDNILQWSDAAQQKFLELADEGSTVFNVQLNKNCDWNSPNIVSLWMNEINIVDQLQDLCDKCVVTLERAVNSFEIYSANVNMSAFEGTVITTIYHSPTNLYLQYHASNELLSEISNILTFPDLRDYASPAVDEICAALFEEDSVFYRAKVLEVTENGRKVMFIDYGNIATATKFKELPDALKIVRPLVFHCQLVDGENLNQSQMEKIENALFEPDAHFEMEIIDETVEPKMIKLYNGQVDLFQQLGIEPEKDKAKNGTNADFPSGMPPKNKYKSTEVLKELKRSKK